MTSALPENVKQLVAAAAKEYQWPEEHFQKVEKAIHEYPWTPEQIAKVEKAVLEGQWTTKEIADVDEAFRKNELTDGFFVNHPNDKLKKFDAKAFSTDSSSGTVKLTSERALPRGHNVGACNIG